MQIDALGLPINNAVVGNQPTKVEDSTFSSMLEQAQKNEDNAKLWEACQQFESVFINQVLKKMRESVPKNELFNGGMGEEVFQGFLDQEIANNVATSGNGLGLAKMIFEQMTQSTLVRPPIKEAVATETK